MADDLINLAQRLVDLDKEIADVRSRMLTLLTNGHGEPASIRPTSPRKGERRAAIMEQAAAEEERIVGLLRAAPMTTGEIAKATQGKASSVQNRLARLEKRNLVVRGDGGAWSATSTQI
jgi:hypothetical protein